MDYTIYTTYALVPTGNTAGYGRAIHCNYINMLEITTNDISIQEIRLNFNNINDFKFLASDILNKTGYTTHKIYIIFQYVETGNKPDSTAWKYLDVTNQITGYAGILTAANLTSVVFKVPLNLYSSYSTYILSYLDYPLKTNTTGLCFGDETYFFGNVTTTIRADVYVLDLSIILELDEFNSSNNPTWDESAQVFMTEIGLYDEDRNLVAIGKFNNPLPKDSTITRTISFAIDF